MRVFVDHPGLHHQEEAGLVPRQHVQRRLHLFGQVGLVGKLLDAAALEKLAVQRAIHVAGGEQPEQLARVRFRRRRIELGLRHRHLITGVAKAGDVVDIVLAFGAGRGLRQEIRSSAAHQDVGPGGEILLDDLVIGGAAAGMRDHRRRRGILDFGIGDDADRHAEPPLRQAGDGFDLGIVERACGAVGIDAHRVDGGLVAGGVGAGRIRRIGDDRNRSRRSPPAPCAACRRWQACRGSCPPRSPWRGCARRPGGRATTRRR